MFKKNNKSILKWEKNNLLVYANKWLKKLKKRKGPAKEDSLCWIFFYEFKNLIEKTTQDFINGVYKFSPMETLTFNNNDPHETETIIIWSYCDRLVIKWILNILKPVFKHIVHFSCHHIQGPNGVKVLVKKIKEILKKNKFRYVIRADVKSFYASINRKILTNQIEQNFNDPRILKYLTDIINNLIIKDATYFTPDFGLPLRSSLSPLFAALYLYPLDHAFAKLKGIYYCRYMDDILILAETKKQFLKAKRKLKNILTQLKLSLSRSKTKMGELKSTFHFLGINFALPQSEQFTTKNHTITNCVAQLESSNQKLISLHGRSVRRSLDKVNRMKADSVHPEKIQGYVNRWAVWWAKIGTPYFFYKDCLLNWTELAKVNKSFNQNSWLGSGLMAFN